ncbi:MAG: P-II family nitrogen regulator [Tannerellaceae bacterium]|jgi:nitrogen regulatory protein PII 2|nr:P-II family nitrogen regulator [Tannerellaceae bacterium]
MKLILAVIRIAKMGETKQALADAGLPSFTAMPVLGRGQGRGDFSPAKVPLPLLEDETMALSTNSGSRLKPKRMITLVVKDDKKDLAIETILKVNHTGESGDGKIFVVNTLESYTVHSGLSGIESLD